MSDWIDDLKRAEETKDRAQRQSEEWRLRCDRLIAAKAPDLWRALVERVASDVKRLAEEFPDRDSMRLEFVERSEDHFRLTNPSQHQNFMAVWVPNERIISLEFRNRPDALSDMQVRRDTIRFFVTNQDDVQMKFGGTVLLESISERLIKEVL